MEEEMRERELVPLVVTYKLVTKHVVVRYADGSSGVESRHEFESTLSEAEFPNDGGEDIDIPF